MGLDIVGVDSAILVTESPSLTSVTEANDFSNLTSESKTDRCYTDDN